jgi:hypothetical protein
MNLWAQLAGGAAEAELGVAARIAAQARRRRMACRI